MCRRVISPIGGRYQLVSSTTTLSSLRKGQQQLCKRWVARSRSRFLISNAPFLEPSWGHECRKRINLIGLLHRHGCGPGARGTGALLTHNWPAVCVSCRLRSRSAAA